MAFLSVDIGTSGCKACLVDEDGEIFAEKRSPFSLLVQGARVELELDTLWSLFRKSVRALLKKTGNYQVETVGISTLLGYVFLDAKNRPLRPAILYLDSRASEECRDSSHRMDLAGLYSRTGRRLTPELLAPQLLWVRKNEPDIFQAIHRITGLKDYLVYCLTGELGTDPAHLNYTFLYDIDKGRFDPGLLDWVSLREEVFPACLYPYELMGRVTRESSRETGITNGTPVIVGCTDGTTAMYGGGIVKPGAAVLVSGSTDVCMALSSKLISDTNSPLSQNTGMVNGTYALGGATGFSWGALLRLKELFPIHEEVHIPKIGAVPMGSSGLAVFPGITGERAPYWNAQARGAVLGWGMEHTYLHFLRAFVEGTAYRVNRILRTLQEERIGISVLHLVGGGARWDVVNQIRANIFGIPVVRLKHTEATILGTALFSAVAARLFSSIEEGSQSWIHLEQAYDPDIQAVETYKGLFHEYEELLHRVYGEY